ncbi:MAG: SDR family NAD(P)-dependent oxidoreductase [Acidimicrobiia bacterium]
MSEARVAVVTGASRGIGRATALAFARKGYRVVVAARSTDANPNKAGLPGTVDSLAAEAGGAGAIVTVAADLSKPEAVEAVATTTLDTFGRCDVLINNAAISFLGKFVDVPARRWTPVINVNLLAPVALIEAFLPGMIERGDGRIINVSSGAADTREPGVEQLPYSASKAAIESLSFGLAWQLAGSGVSVNAVRPTVATEAVTHHAPNLLTDQPGRWALPTDYAAALLWLAEQPASFTGELIDNDRFKQLGVLP